MVHTCYLARTHIQSMRIYINEKKLPLSAIVEQEAPDLAITGNFYGPGWVPVCPLKADGRVLEYDPEYAYPALCWDEGPDVGVEIVPKGGMSPQRNYIANCAGIYAGQDQPMFYGSDVGGRRGRTGWGLRDGELALLAFPDGSDGMTPLETRAYAKAQGWSDFILGDGGQKVNFYDREAGVLLEGKDPSQNLILIWRKKEEETSMDGITQRMMTRNPCYTSGRTIAPKGIMVHSTATPGVMAEALAKVWDTPTASAAVHAIVDDKVTLQTLPWTARGGHAGGQAGTANGTHIAFEICEPQACRLLPEEWVPAKRGSTGWAVERLQRELTARGYDPKGIDGSFGPGCDAALRACQKDLGLAADGSCGPATLAALAQREGSFLAYDPGEVREYFEAAWDRAVALAAYLCRTFSLEPMTHILDHREGHALGIASNHADVGHWFPRHGKSMDDFRAAVKEALTGERVSELDAAVDKLSAAGLIDSPDYWKGGTYSADNVKELLIKWAANI